MDVLPLPPRPDINQYRKRAKDLVKAANAGDPAAVTQWARHWLDALASSLGVTVTPFVQGSIDRAVHTIEQRVRAETDKDTFTLAQAHFLIANAHGFPNWSAFAAHVDPGSESDSSGQPFDVAA